MAADHPEWKTKQPFKAVLDGDRTAVAAAGEKAAVELIAATHTGMTVDEFEASVRLWIREWAYDRESRIGKLARGLDGAAARGWVLIDMKRDWRVIHPTK